MQLVTDIVRFNKMMLTRSARLLCTPTVKQLLFPSIISRNTQTQSHPSHNLTVTNLGLTHNSQQVSDLSKAAAGAFEKGELPQARELYNKAIQANPLHASLYVDRAKVYPQIKHAYYL